MNHKPLLRIPRKHSPVDYVEAVLGGVVAGEPQGTVVPHPAPDFRTGDWKGKLRDRLVFSVLAETGMRLGEVLGMTIGALSRFYLSRFYVVWALRADRPGSCAGFGR
jgi:hypothetical protein